MNQSTRCDLTSSVRFTTARKSTYSVLPREESASEEDAAVEEEEEEQEEMREEEREREGRER
eukprot:3131447-Rhodomonas_salina.1